MKVSKVFSVMTMTLSILASLTGCSSGNHRHASASGPAVYTTNLPALTMADIRAINKPDDRIPKEVVFAAMGALGLADESDCAGDPGPCPDLGTITDFINNMTVTCPPYTVYNQLCIDNIKVGEILRVKGLDHDRRQCYCLCEEVWPDDPAKFQNCAINVCEITFWTEVNDLMDSLKADMIRLCCAAYP